MENDLIKIWKETAQAYLQSKKIMNNLEGKETNEEEIYKEFATRQLELIEMHKPNKDKTAKEQMNETQKQTWDYLTKVKETGKLQWD